MTASNVIIDAITACKTADDVTRCAISYKDDLVAMTAKDAQEIKDYAALKRRRIESNNKNHDCDDCGHLIAPFGVSVGGKIKWHCNGCSPEKGG